MDRENAFGKALSRFAGKNTPAKPVWLILLGLVATGCSSTPNQASRFADSSRQLHQTISRDLQKGEPLKARELIATALRNEPNNGYLHLLNGLTYQLEGSSMQCLSLAKVGYDAAVKFAPGFYWSHYLAGSVALQMNENPRASEHFANAILLDPERPEAFLGLATAAYASGDLDVADIAAARARAIIPDNADGWLIGAYSAASKGEPNRLNELLNAAEANVAVAPAIESHKSRLTQIVRTARAQPRLGDAQDESDPPIAEQVVNPNQVMVEVTLLLNQASEANNTGINLLDGLSVQYGMQYQTNITNTTGAPESISRVFTSTIQVPEITYSLNLFNTRTDYYRVLARPSLVAYLNEPSEFFIGRTVTVAVSGINLGSIAPVDIGITVRVIPIEITPVQTRFKVEVIRSFFSQETGGTFAQSLTMFKQTVAATAEVEFGKTMILSGLYEGVDVGGSSKTPGLGDLPVIDTLFNARTESRRRDMALMLVTPRLAGSVQTDTREFRGEALQSLLELWNELIDPTSNMSEILDTLRKRWRSNTTPPANRAGATTWNQLKLVLQDLAIATP